MDKILILVMIFFGAYSQAPMHAKEAQRTKTSFELLQTKLLKSEVDRIIVKKDNFTYAAQKHGDGLRIHVGKDNGDVSIHQITYNANKHGQVISRTEQGSLVVKKEPAVPASEQSEFNKITRILYEGVR